MVGDASRTKFDLFLGPMSDTHDNLNFLSVPIVVLFMAYK